MVSFRDAFHFLFIAMHYLRYFPAEIGFNQDKEDRMVFLDRNGSEMHLLSPANFRNIQCASLEAPASPEVSPAQRNWQEFHYSTRGVPRR